VQDPVGDLVGAAGEGHAARLELGLGGRAGTSAGGHLGGAGREHPHLVLEVGGLGRAVVLGDEAVHGDGDVGGVAGWPTCAHASR
jgi:hypothetical protein